MQLDHHRHLFSKEVLSALYNWSTNIILTLSCLIKKGKLKQYSYTILRIQLKLNTALLSTVRSSVCVSQA